MCGNYYYLTGVNRLVQRRFDPDKEHSELPDYIDNIDGFNRGKVVI